MPYVDAELPEGRQPICGYSIERVGVVDCIYNANDMSLAYLGLEVRPVLRTT